MATNLDVTAACQYPDSSEHRLSMPPTIMDLPDDAVEEIARRAGDSLCNLALSHPRFASIFSRMRRARIEATHICENLRRSVVHQSGNVRVLILMNCHSESSLILPLILECPHLTELNVVNSGLTTPDLLQSLEFLSELETLSFGAAGIPGYSTAFPHPDHGSLRNVYVEFGFEGMALAFVVNLINSCLKIERLHLTRMPYRPNDDSQLFPYSEVDEVPFISRERWRTLQTVIYTAGFYGELNRGEIVRRIFGLRPARSDGVVEILPQITEIVYHRGIFNEIVPRERIAVDHSLFRNRMYVVSSEDPVWHYGEPRHLRIENPRLWSPTGSLPQSIASLTTLVELDVCRWHSEDSPEMWEQLFQSSAGLKYLKVSFCLLKLRSSDPTRNNVFPLVKALEKLQLKKLHCAGLTCKTKLQCHWHGKVPDFTGLTNLDELTLIDLPVDKNFLNRIAIRSMSCLKLYYPGPRDLDLSKLEMLLTTCKNLRYLKMDWHSLPLHEELLWQPLSQANLKQLCIRSFSTEPVNLRMVRKSLPGILQGMNVLHVHAPDLKNAEEFSSLVTMEIDKINIIREHNPIRAILPTSLDRSVNPGFNMFSNFPGRALCCFRTNPRHALMGWTHDD